MLSESDFPGCAGRKPVSRPSRLRACDVQRITEPGMYADGDGLYFRVRSTGARSWIFVGVRSGRRREMGLGATGTASLAQARTLARKAKLAFEAGRDPIAERLIANDGGQPRGMSFGHFFNGFDQTASKAVSETRSIANSGVRHSRHMRPF